MKEYKSAIPLFGIARAGKKTLPFCKLNFILKHFIFHQVNWPENSNKTLVLQTVF